MSKQAPQTKFSTTFGIEVEGHLPYNGLTVGAYHQKTDSNDLGLQVGIDELVGYHLQRDGSVKGFNQTERQPVEVVSPILSTWDHIGDYLGAWEGLQALGFKSNKSCGTHIHLGYKDEADKTRMVRVYRNIEKALYGLNGREYLTRANNGYCRPITFQTQAPNWGSRYTGLNTQTGKPTIEIRIWAKAKTHEQLIVQVLVSLALAEGCFDDAPEGMTTAQQIQFILDNFWEGLPDVTNEMVRQWELSMANSY